jgi:hypothetical protein
MNPATLIAKGVELLSKIPPDVLEHAVSFLDGIVTGDKLKASRAATSALISRFWRRARS